MHFEFRNYQLSKTKNYFRKKLLFFANGANKNSQDWLLVEQSLSNSKLKYYKIYNKISLKVLKNSIYKNIKQIVRGTFFLLHLKETSALINKQKLLKTLESTFFTLLSIKINNKIYSINQIKNIRSFNYKNNMAVLYQFLLTNLKYIYGVRNKKISKQCDLNT